MTPDIATSPGEPRPGLLRTAVTLALLLAVLLGSWALVIGAVVLVYRLFT